MSGWLRPGRGGWETSYGGHLEKPVLGMAVRVGGRLAGSSDQGPSPSENATVILPILKWALYEGLRHSCGSSYFLHEWSQNPLFLIAVSSLGLPFSFTTREESPLVCVMGPSQKKCSRLGFQNPWNTLTVL